MRNNDFQKTEEARTALMQALVNNDKDAFNAAFEQLIVALGDDVRREYEAMIKENDVVALANRGIRQLTSEEKEFYQKFSDCLRSGNPKQALANANLVLPETVINDVFTDLETNRPLISKITFFPSNGATKFLVNTDGHQEAQWGDLCEEIVKELTSGFEEKDTNLLKLSAYLPVCKAMLELGPEWLDNYVRKVLYEALANGLEAGLVAGDGKNKPIGMNRQVGKGVTVTDGVYPEKEAIAITDLDPVTIGNLLAQVAVTPNGKTRKLHDIIMVVNPLDYLQKVFPATTVMAPDGTYRKDVLPYPMEVIESAAMPVGRMALGMAPRYFAAVGTATTKSGKLDYSDHYAFLEDKRTYLIKLYANGFPMDNNAFLYLNIENLQPKTYKVQVTETAEAAAVNDTEE